jgi:hypothetical protein
VSVTICWRPASDTGKHFEGGTSNSLAKLKSVFGGVIREKDIPTLRAMAVAASDEFYSEVADVVENVGDIHFWGEH